MARVRYILYNSKITYVDMFVFKEKATLFKSHKCVLFDQFEKQSLYYEFFNRLQKMIQQIT